jgi:hypothetical protein
MQSPRIPGTGITGAATKSLSGDALQPTEFGPEMQRRYRRASHPNHQADALLFAGRHALAERLAHRAEERRQGTP